MLSFKRVLASFFSPLSLSIEMIACGLLLLCFSRKQNVGKILITLGFILLVVSGYEGVSGRIIHTLESQYPPINLSQVMPP
ncbi:MAG: hypothetical protein ABI618_17970, partial [Nitrospirota bacterium]